MLFSNVATCMTEKSAASVTKCVKTTMYSVNLQCITCVPASKLVSSEVLIYTQYFEMVFPWCPS